MNRIMMSLRCTVIGISKSVLPNCPVESDMSDTILIAGVTGWMYRWVLKFYK